MPHLLRRISLTLTFTLACAMGVLALLMERDWVDFSELDVYKIAQPSAVLDDEGAIITTFELDKRVPVAFDKLPKNLIDAFVAAEDHDFFKHTGISLRGMLRSMFVNLYHGRVVQGASTITQQITKLMFLSYQRTWLRKVQEIFLAFQLERQLSKEQILELYLNNIYFGRGIYGVEAACRRMWNKPLDQLALHEAATLAAVAKSAKLYSPLNSPGSAKKRRDLILKVMLQLQSIDQKQYTAATAAPVQIRDYAPGNPIRMYVHEWIRLWAEQQFGKEALYHDGLKIKTTINTHTQEKAEKAFSQGVAEIRLKLGNKLNGGMMSIEPHSGQIKVLIGGYDFKQSQFNRATQAFRQTGSSFKPILFALALRAGIPMDTIFIDEPIEMTMPNGTIWRPMNWHDRFDGPMTLARALACSCNTIAIKLFLKIGSNYIIPWTKPFGLHRSLTAYPSAALGTVEATVEENVAAFNVFANNGVYVKPYLVEWVKDAHGNKRYVAEHHQHPVLNASINTRMINLLSKRLGETWIDGDAIGKTGSTNGAASAWFVGATPTLTTALYIGCDDNTPMGRRLLASRSALPIWLNFQKSMPRSSKKFYRDPSLHEYCVNWVTGERGGSPSSPDIVTLLE